MREPPGTQRPRRFYPRFHWELLVCGVRGHELIGTDAAHVGPEHRVFAREQDGVRWYRCVRCDSWLPLPPPGNPARAEPPPRDEIELPLRGKALRDKVVLRAIAIDRAFHFVVLGAVAVAIVLVAAHELRLREFIFRVVNGVEGTSGNPTSQTHGIVHTVLHALELRSSTLYLLAAAAGGYAVLEGVEAVGLWYQRRWAEYLTFLAVVVFLPYEIWELSKSISALKIAALVLNVVIAVYLLLAKRLFGLRGGADAEARERLRDQGWSALEETTP
ncbi:MAG TPA: DUF2127 domain-containing protein [Gaiellaceae bacterium]|jgi:uncharacterized membrane protein (DUF2068 family)